MKKRDYGIIVCFNVRLAKAHKSNTEVGILSILFFCLVIMNGYCMKVAVNKLIDSKSWMCMVIFPKMKVVLNLIR